MKSIWTNILAAPYCPEDGMNECGVAIAILSVPPMKFEADPQKITIYRWEVSRLILDYAKNLDEAIALLSKFNINVGSENDNIHYFVADASGNSAVIEEVNGKMVITKNEKPWQVVTNFLLYNDSGNNGCFRYYMATNVLAKQKGILSETSSMQLLSDISQNNTVWSAVYNLHTKELNLNLGKQYDLIKKFQLQRE